MQRWLHHVRTLSSTVAIIAGVATVAGCVPTASRQGNSAASAPPLALADAPRPPQRPLTAVKDIPRDTAANRAQRFAILKTLEQKNLITPEEYAQRRDANLGALLPMTHPQAAAEGLDRAPPTVNEEMDRLDQLAKAVETRNLTADQMAQERAAILDALLPAKVQKKALPPPPPANTMEAGERISQLEDWRAAGLISNDEFSRERAAVQRSLGAPAVAHEEPVTPPPAKAPVKKKAAPQKSSAHPAKEKPPESAAHAEDAHGKEAPKEPSKPVHPKSETDAAGENPAAVLKSGRMREETVPYKPDTTDHARNGASVFLSTLKSRDGATREWESLKERFPELQSLQPRITTLTLPDKGTIYRLNAGPFPTMDAAKAFCEKLKGKQYCEETNLGG